MNKSWFDQAIDRLDTFDPDIANLLKEREVLREALNYIHGQVGACASLESRRIIGKACSKALAWEPPK